MVDITIIIPSYNHAAFIEKRIESVLLQTYQEYELIIIDDNSLDNSDKIIRSMRGDRRITYIRNSKNSGSPFSSWIKGAYMAKGEYIWICESDDFAESSFLEKAMNTLQANPNAVLYYTNSNYVDEYNNIIGGTEQYFDEVWKNARWKKAFIVDGINELEQYQFYGQTVPNMSSAVIRKDAFKESCIKYLKRFKLAGDWLLIGLVMTHGEVVFNPEHLNNFRQHSNTARVRVKSARSQAEYVLTKFYLHMELKKSNNELMHLLRNDVIRFLYEDANVKEILAVMLRISPYNTLSLGIRILLEIIADRKYIDYFIQHKRISQERFERRD